MGRPGLQDPTQKHRGPSQLQGLRGPGLGLDAVFPGPQTSEQAPQQPPPSCCPDTHGTPSLQAAAHTGARRRLAHTHTGAAHCPPDSAPHDLRLPGPSTSRPGDLLCCVVSLGPAGEPLLSLGLGAPSGSRPTVTGPSQGGRQPTTSASAGAGPTASQGAAAGDPEGPGSRQDLGHCSPRAYSHGGPGPACPVSGDSPGCGACVACPGPGAGHVSGHRAPVTGPAWLSPEDVTAAPSLPQWRGRTPYLPASEATLVAGGHLLAF